MPCLGKCIFCKEIANVYGVAPKYDFGYYVVTGIKMPCLGKCIFCKEIANVYGVAPN